MTLKQSSAVHIQALVSADGILPGFCWLTSAFSYKFSFSSGRTAGQFPNCTKPRPLAEIYSNTQMMEAQNNNPFNILIGQKLSSVTFVMNYLQIDFDGNRFTLNIFPIIKSRGSVFKSEKQFYRDNLCELIGKVVSSVNVKNEEVLTIVFDPDNSISVLLVASSPEITFPEIAVFVNTENKTFVF